MDFPILTFDEVKLRPSWGYVFDSHWLDPYESIVSILWKFVWMNRLSGHAVVGHIARRSVDPYAGIEIMPKEIDANYVAKTLGIPLKTVWQSIPDPIPRRAPTSVLRYCPRCMARGYHCVVHQFGSVLRCPIHATLLETLCRGCGATSDYRIDARILDAPFKCPQCRKAYAPSWPHFSSRRALTMQQRTALTRTFIG